MILEILFEVIFLTAVRVILLYPGAFVYYLAKRLFRHKTSIKKLVVEEPWASSTIGIITAVIIIILIVTL